MIGILKLNNNHFSDNLKIFEEILNFNSIKSIRLDINDPQFWEKLNDLDLLIFRYNVVTDLKILAETIMPLIENYLKINCYPDLSTGWHYDDKIKEYYLLRQQGYPVIESNIFWDKNAALEWIENAEYPTIFKLKAGSQSDGVVLVKDKTFAISLTKRMFSKGRRVGRVPALSSIKLKDTSLKKLLRQNAIKIYRTILGKDINQSWDIHKNYVLFQEFQYSNDYDTRVMVIGKRAFAFRRFNRKNDFRASGSSHQDQDQSKIDKRTIKIAFKISEEQKFQSMAYDFLNDRNGNPVIAEISYTFPMKKAWPGYWDDRLSWHSGHFWPQYFILIDSLKNPNLRQPNMNIV